MFNPVATYRLQFNKDFTLSHALKILPYLHRLGVKTIYASPIYSSVPGSVHGYDGTNPNRIDPETGTEGELEILSSELKKYGMGWIQDIVPNHMAFHPDNTWLMDMLEKGPASEYVSFFDMATDSDGHDGRIMAPFLGESLEQVIAKGDLKIAHRDGRLFFTYVEQSYPLKASSYKSVLEYGNAPVPDTLREHITADENNRAPKGFPDDDSARSYIDGCLEKINSDPAQLRRLADEQYYRLCHWQETDSQINYRRFFTVNGLICLHIQETEVFQRFHQLTRVLLEKNVFQGLRVDHIDGLYDPTGYLDNLRDLAGEETYITVEKILQPDENLPNYWPVQGNTGYDFLAMVNNLLTYPGSKEKFTLFYNRLTGNIQPVQHHLYEKKAYILYHHMAGELENLHQLFLRSGLVHDAELSALSPSDLKNVIAEFLIQCPVYRYYGNHFPLHEAEKAAVLTVLDRCRKNKPGLQNAINLLQKVLLVRPENNNPEYNRNVLHFYRRCMQFTGPLMAKGMEDTLMYSYNNFIGHNEVGDSPEAFGLTPAAFHRKMQGRQEKWALSMNGTSTHDTKRGEDARARLNVLTAISAEWFTIVQEWSAMNASLKRNNIPDANDEYFIYQALAGSYPMPGQEHDNFAERFREYLRKALREAKTHSGWAKPNEEYEEGTSTFAAALLEENTPFFASFRSFFQRIADPGIVNSLSQVLLKFTCPGIPDLYQGTELWDLSLVDPDNRRPVNYGRRGQMLSAIGKEAGKETLRSLWNSRYDGRIKLWLTHRLLHERNENPEAFARGHYVPLKVKGKYKDMVLAFARRFRHTWYITVVPLYPKHAHDASGSPAGDWDDTHIVLPDEAPAEWEHLLTDAKGKRTASIFLKDIFVFLPLALLRLKSPENPRGAGLLLPAASLPSAYGIGDLGPGARSFADFLSRSCQKYWQLLPLNPTRTEQGHSPYSSVSSMAGNILLISPDLLVEDGLLNMSDVAGRQVQSSPEIEYAMAERIKTELLEKAYRRFREGNFESMNRKFKKFCVKEAYWLDDFSLYRVIRKEQGKPWNLWPEKYRDRDPEALENFTKEHEETLRKIKWSQFIFYRQLHSLRAYCNDLGILLFGDLPFYLSYDSADIWAHPDIFCLDENRAMSGVAGVPPDYFSATGQLWGMPTFRWDKLKEQEYDWWICRLRKNLELFDILRLDHFRAFAGYWEVPAGEETAVNGKWKPGPGADFFRVVEDKLGKLPFVAEDLGDYMEDVYRLRDEIGLPGMKVLQFAFGENMPTAVDTPHNFTTNCIVYTGTHDNNTTLGWYRQEASRSHRERLRQYTGIKIGAKDICKMMGRIAYASVARIAILPVQDVLELDEKFRLNTPGSGEGNWLWQLQPDQLGDRQEKRLRKWTTWYNRR